LRGDELAPVAAPARETEAPIQSDKAALVALLGAVLSLAFLLGWTLAVWSPGLR
jgi:hypothetical protein